MKIRSYVSRTIFAMILILLLFTFFVNRLTEPAANPIKVDTTLSVGWNGGDTNFSKTLSTVLEKFEAQEPDIKLTLLTLPESSFPENEWRKLYLADSWPDLMEVTNLSFVQQFQLIRPIPKSWNSLVSSEDLLKGSDTRWTLPLQINDDSRYLCIYYNKALFREHGLQVPRNYDEFLRLCKELSRITATPFGVAGAGNRGLCDLFTMYLAEYLGKHPDFYQDLAAGSTAFDAEYLSLFTSIKKLLTDYGLEEWTTYTDNGLIADFSAGKSAMIVTDKRIYAQAEKTAYFEIGSFLLPTAVDNHYYAVSGLNQRHWVISQKAFADSNKRAALTKLINYYYSHETLESFYNNGSFPPPVKSWEPQSNLPPDNYIQELNALIEKSNPVITTLPMKEIPYLFQFFSIQTDCLRRYLTDDMTLDEVGFFLQTQWKSLQQKEMKE